jgi:hypothetical protein
MTDISLGLFSDGLEPVILFLDGASRWNTQALRTPHDNSVFVFFASHTSVWAQPSDCQLKQLILHYD